MTPNRCTINGGGTRVIGPTCGEPMYPRWLVDRLGVDYFGNVSYVHFRQNTQASDTEVAELRVLNRLEQLYLLDTKITDNGSVAALVWPGVIA